MTALTPQPGADPGVPGVPGVTRRSLLRASPALLAPPLVAGPVLLACSAMASPVETAPADTPILSLYRQWVALDADLSARPGITDEDLDAGVAAMEALEARMASEPVTGAADLAAKMLVLAGVTDRGATRHEAALVVECEALVDGRVQP